MSGATKHMERSHKTRNRNYSEFRKFTFRALRASDLKKTRKSAKKPIIERIKSLFTRKHQDR